MGTPPPAYFMDFLLSFFLFFFTPASGGTGHITGRQDGRYARMHEYRGTYPYYCVLLINIYVAYK